MALGMTYSEYWNCSPSVYKAYREAHRLKADQKNQEMWLQGFYVFKAIETALHNQPAFATKKIEPISYLEKPIPLSPPSEEERKEREKELKEKQLIGLKLYLMQHQEQWERKYGRSSSKQAKNNP